MPSTAFNSQGKAFFSNQSKDSALLITGCEQDFSGRADQNCHRCWNSEYQGVLSHLLVWSGFHYIPVLQFGLMTFSTPTIKSAPAPLISVQFIYFILLLFIHNSLSSLWKGHHSYDILIFPWYFFSLFNWAKQWTRIIHLADKWLSPPLSTACFIWVLISSRYIKTSFNGLST